MKKFLIAAIPVLALSFIIPAMAADDVAPEPVAIETAPADAAAAGTEEVKDIADTASANPEFSTLVTALKAAGWIDTLKGEGPFTLFAPTNEAFAKLPKGTVEQWLKPENKDNLVAILKRHIIQGKVVAADGLTGGAKVVKADIVAKNGVIHAIDTVQVK